MRFLPATLGLVLVATGALADPFVPAVPDDSKDAANRAMDSFEKGRFSDAEKLYEQILTSHPDNLFALSNLGVVQFRLGKIELAKEALERAVAVAPDDVFAHCTLGIVYSSQGLRDKAMTEVARALAIDPKNSWVQGTMRMIQNEPVTRKIPPFGDFDTKHERELRQSLASPAPIGEIGLAPGTGQ